MQITKIIELLEARSNPAQNPKQSVYKELSKYAGQKDVYVTFSSVNKMGIFPSSEFNTPIGFYAYPVDFILDNMKEFPLSKARPYPDQQFSKYMLITRLVDSSGIHDVTDTISAHVYNLIKSNDFFKDVTDYSKIITYGNLWILMYMIVAASIHGLKLEQSSEDAYVPNEDQFSGGEDMSIGRTTLNVFRQLRINGITDVTGKGYIHHYEPTQAVFFNIRNLKHIDTLLDKNDPNVLEDVRITNDTSADEIIELLQNMQEKDFTLPYREASNLKQWFVNNFSQCCFNYNHKTMNLLLVVDEKTRGSAIQSLQQLNVHGLSAFLVKCANNQSLWCLICRIFRMNPNLGASDKVSIDDFVSKWTKYILDYKIS